MGRPPKDSELKDKLKAIAGEFELINAPLSEIYFDSEFNCRGDFSYESVGQLAESIGHHGLQVPVILWPRSDLPGGKKYQLIAGHRRFRAFELLKQERIPALVRPDMTERKAHIINLMENIDRKDLNVIEEGKALKRLYPEGMPLRKIRKEIKQSERWIQSRQRVIQLPKEVCNKFASGRIPLQFIDKLWHLQNNRGAKACKKAATEIEKSRKPTKGVIKHSDLPEYLAGQRKPTQKEIIEMVTTMLDATVIGLGPRMGAWCAGFITKDELMRDIDQFKKNLPNPCPDDVERES